MHLNTYTHTCRFLLLEQVYNGLGIHKSIAEQVMEKLHPRTELLYDKHQTSKEPSPNRYITKTESLYNVHQTAV